MNFKPAKKQRLILRGQSIPELLKRPDTTSRAASDNTNLLIYVWLRI